MLNCSLFQSFVSDPVKRDPILDQFSMITRPYPSLNGLKATPFPAAHTRIANILEYPPPRSPTVVFHPLIVMAGLVDSRERRTVLNFLLFSGTRCKV